MGSEIKFRVGDKVKNRFGREGRIVDGWVDNEGGLKFVIHRVFYCDFGGMPGEYKNVYGDELCKKYPGS